MQITYVDPDVENNLKFGYFNHFYTTLSCNRLPFEYEIFLRFRKKTNTTFQLTFEYDFGKDNFGMDNLLRSARVFRFTVNRGILNGVYSILHQNWDFNGYKVYCVFPISLVSCMILKSILGLLGTCFLGILVYHLTPWQTLIYYFHTVWTSWFCRKIVFFQRFPLEDFMANLHYNVKRITRVVLDTSIFI